MARAPGTMSSRMGTGYTSPIRQRLPLERKMLYHALLCFIMRYHVLLCFILLPTSRAASFGIPTSPQLVVRSRTEVLPQCFTRFHTIPPYATIFQKTPQLSTILLDIPQYSEHTTDDHDSQLVEPCTLSSQLVPYSSCKLKLLTLTHP